MAEIDPPIDGMLLDELQQSRPFPSPGQEAVVGIARTASVLNRMAAAILDPEGISVAQYNVLRILRGAGADGLPTLSIRDRMIDPAAAITRLVDKLETAGLISRERVPGDRRQVICRITPAGTALLARLDPAMRATDAVLATELSDDELKILNRFLAKIRRAVRP
jgi:MarR family transcriptional regulator, organic hydroperoxide resistance regulator